MNVHLTRRTTDVTMFQRGSTYVISSQKGLAGTLLREHKTSTQLVDFV